MSRIGMSKHQGHLAIAFFVALATLKFLVLAWILFSDLSIFNRAGDADKYHLAAIGLIQVPSSIWGELLLQLNLFGFYNREYLSLFLAFLQTYVAPALFIVAIAGRRNITGRLILFALCFSLYPTVVAYSMDIYRDSFMLFIFLAFLVLIKLSIESNSLVRQFVIILVASVVLFYFRKYLGFGIVLGWILGHLIYYMVVQKKQGVRFLLLMVLLFFLAKEFMLLTLLDRYRESFDIGSYTMFFLIPLMDSYPLLGVSVSFLLQTVGLYLVSPITVVFFLFESVPFLLALYYVLKNTSLWNKYVSFLIGFFIAYSAVWSYASINFGTAVRLRIFTYTVIFIAAIYIYYLKRRQIDKKIGFEPIS